MIPVLNIIHLSPEQFPADSPIRTEAISREHHFKSQAYEHKFTYGVWDGIIDKHLPWRGVSQSHKQIVQHAKDNGLSCCFIAEDDFKLRPGGWKWFSDAFPAEFDIYLGGISGGNVNEETKEVTGWSGLFFYCVHSRFYDAFLSAEEDKEIDRWLSGTGLPQVEKILGRKPVYKVCYPMAAITKDGISCKTGQYVQHNKFFKSYQVL